jgi:hypothetical protein
MKGGFSMQAILFCDRQTDCIPLQDCPEALLPYCNIPLIVHILRFLELHDFTSATLLSADAQVQQLVDSLPLHMSVQYGVSLGKLRAQAPTLLLRRLSLPDWDVGELETLCAGGPLTLVHKDGTPTCAELHPIGSGFPQPQRQAVAVLSRFRRAERPDEYLQMQDALLKSGNLERFRLGQGLRMGRGAAVDGSSILGSDCVIGEYARLEHCCIGDGVQIGAGAVLRNCIICRHALIDRDVHLENSVIGQDKHLPPSAGIPESRRFFVLPEDGICNGLPRWNSAGTALEAGAALTVLGSRMAVGYSDAPGEVLAAAAAAGAVSQGAQVWQAGICSLSQLIHAGLTAGCQVLLWVHGDGVLHLLPFSGGGFPLTMQQSRRVQQALEAKVSTRILNCGKFTDARCLLALWEEECRQLLPEKLPEIGISCGNPALRLTAERIFSGGSGERITLYLSEDGTQASAFSLDSGMVRAEQLQLLSLLSMREQGEAMALPADFHPAAEEFAARSGGRIMRLHTAGQSPVAARLFEKQGICTDGIRLFAHILRILHKRQISLKSAAALLPPMYTVQHEISTRISRKAVEKLQRSNPDPMVHLFLPPRGRLLHLRVHGTSMEAAQELCGVWEKRVKMAEQEL